MQNNLSNLQFQQMQMLQQQQRLAAMMQQKSRGYPPPQQNWDEYNKQQLLQQQRIMQSQPKEMSMMRLPNAGVYPSRPSQPQITLPSQQQTSQQPIVPSINPPINPVNAEPTKIVPVETDAQRQQLQQYQLRDEAYQDTLNLQHKRHIELAQSKKRAIEFASLERRTRMQHGPAVAFGPGYRGFGNGTTGTQSRIRFPRSKKRNRASKRETFKFSMEALEEQAKKEDTLVPIRIELEHEGYKLRDTFTWNLHESLITPEQFADVMCEDLKLPTNIFSDQIAKAIREQIEDYSLNASSMVKEDIEESTAVEDGTTPADSDKEKIHDKQGIELRTVIKLDITVGNWELVDQFEWDIGCPRNSPEEFAHKLTTDLGLAGEFKTAIAHSIREQIHVYIKSLLLVGYEFNTDSTIDDEIRHSFLPRLKRIIRDGKAVEQFTPSVIQLPDAVVEKMSKDRMREARRKRRSTRARRGVVLPDREPQKTHRTGFAVSEQELTDEQFLLNSMADPQLQQTNKRSAALKARMNIAAEASLGDDFIENGTTTPNRNMQGVISFNSGNTMMKPNYQLSWQHHR